MSADETTTVRVYDRDADWLHDHMERGESMADVIRRVRETVDDTEL